MSRIAVFDVGSNSVLCLVAERTDDGWVRVWEACEVTRLAEGLSATNRLSKDAMARTADGLRRLAERASEFNPERVISVGTMAFRTATNAAAFCSRLPVSIRVLSPEEEARYSYLSVARDPLFQGRANLTVVDIGGASTEVATSNSFRSVPIGALTVAGWLGPGPCDSYGILDAIGRIHEVLQAVGHRGPRSVVTVGATGVNLACRMRQIHTFVPEATHGAILRSEFLLEASRDLLSMSVEERQALPWMEPGRAPSIHGGALLLSWLVDEFADEVEVSNRGLRWGILEDL